MHSLGIDLATRHNTSIYQMLTSQVTVRDWFPMVKECKPH
jgi:hypothetical protein